MRILVVGAGAIGGYFGGRLLQAGRDVTFLVRPKRASELASAGLVIKSPAGDVTLKNPPTVQADKLTEKFDVVLLSCKAFDLADAIKSFAPAVGPNALDNPDLLMPPASVAASYWQLYQQPKSAWTFELEIRPFGEKW